MHAGSGNEISYFARTNFRRANTPFGIKQADRLSHLYMLGKTGVGKSTLIETLAMQDLAAGRGFALIDPHGDLVERVWANAPPPSVIELSISTLPMLLSHSDTIRYGGSGTTRFRLPRLACR